MGDTVADVSGDAVNASFHPLDRHRPMRLLILNDKTELPALANKFFSLWCHTRYKWSLYRQTKVLNMIHKFVYSGWSLKNLDEKTLVTCSISGMRVDKRGRVHTERAPVFDANKYFILAIFEWAVAKIQALWRQCRTRCTVCVHLRLCREWPEAVECGPSRWYCNATRNTRLTYRYAYTAEIQQISTVADTHFDECFVVFKHQDIDIGAMISDAECYYHEAHGHDAIQPFPLARIQATMHKFVKRTMKLSRARKRLRMKWVYKLIFTKYERTYYSYFHFKDDLFSLELSLEFKAEFVSPENFRMYEYEVYRYLCNLHRGISDDNWLHWFGKIRLMYPNGRVMGWKLPCDWNHYGGEASKHAHCDWTFTVGGLLNYFYL